MGTHLKTKERDSNFELLRILAMLTIIGVHYLGSSGASELIAPNTLSHELLIIVQTLFNYGVNLFVMITGYYMIGKQSVSVRKVINLLTDVTIYGVILYSVSLLLGLNSFSIPGLMKSALPLLAGYRWFVKAYIVLYLLIPFLNKVLMDLSKQEYLVLLGVFAVFFSLWPSLLPNPPLDDYGFSYQNFIFVYMIAGYIRRFSPEVRLSRCIGTIAAGFFATILVDKLGSMGAPFIATLYGYKWAHNSPLNLLAVTGIFLLFQKLHFHSRSINRLAASAFAVFLIHGDFNTMDYLFNHIFHAGTFYDSLLWLPHLLFSIVVIYLVCFVLDSIKKCLLDRPVTVLFDYIKPLNFEIRASRGSEI